MTLRVVVADDQALVRVGFCGIIAATPGFTVVGEAGNGAEAVEAARRTRPDVILMDVRMPVMDGIEATRRITASTDVRALILTTFDLDEYVFAALRAGASGFLLKDTLPGRPAHRHPGGGGRRRAARAERHPAPDRRVRPHPARHRARRRCARLAAARQRRGPGQPRAGPLPATGFSGCSPSASSRCSQMVARGMSNAEIAEELTISPATAKTHVAHLLTKLDARDRIQLVIIAYQSGPGSALEP